VYRIISALLAITLLILAAGCGNDRPRLPVAKTLKAPTFDDEFRSIWNDGSSEVAVYDTVRLRGGQPRKGSATAITWRTTYALDERVAVSKKTGAQGELFPAIQMNWIERYPTDGLPQQEMTTTVLALQSVDGHVPGVASKVDFSQQAWDGQLFQQLLFDATGVRSHQYSHFENEADEQITLAYPGDGVSSDALWFWARRMAAPALQPGESKAVMLLVSPRDARTARRPMKWQRATLSRDLQKVSAGSPMSRWTVEVEDGSRQQFLVHDSAPFAVEHWENSDGERADLVSIRRSKEESR
jgi:hypothetical protein